MTVEDMDTNFYGVKGSYLWQQYINFKVLLTNYVVFCL